MKARKLIVWMGTVAFILTGCFGGSFTAKATEKPDSEQVSKLLAEAQTMAFQLKEDAVDMESFTRADLDWQVHAAAIGKIKEHFNELSRQVTKLKAERSAASPWQRQAIDQIDPYLDELVGYTSAVIENINKNPALLRTPEYKDYLEANADYASDLAAMIANFVEYGRTKERLQHLTDQLEVPTT